jgi:hypothetical protein
MPRVEFVVAGSPNSSFFSQIFASKSSVFAQSWKNWRPSYRCVFGGAPNWVSLRRWMPRLEDVDIEFLSNVRPGLDTYFAQSERRFSTGDCDTDVFVLLDADTIVLNGIEAILDKVLEAETMAGVTAHYGFPVRDGVAKRADWEDIAKIMLGKSLRYDHTYTLVPEDAPDEIKCCPFYVNAGFIVMSAKIRQDFYRLYSGYRESVESHLIQPYFSGQVALTLAVEAMSLDPISLPMQYNFPNDTNAEKMHPEELEQVRILHYLRRDVIDRERIFRSRGDYLAFLEMNLTGSNQVLQAGARRILGDDYLSHNKL